METSDNSGARAAEPLATSVFVSPQWVAVFMAIAVPASLVPFALGFMLGLSVTNDEVFGSYALVSGLFADYAIRAKFGRVLVLLSSPRIPFIALWIPLCFYVVAFRPFE